MTLYQLFFFALSEPRRCFLSTADVVAAVPVSAVVPVVCMVLEAQRTRSPDVSLDLLIESLK